MVDVVDRLRSKRGGRGDEEDNPFETNKDT